MADAIVEAGTHICKIYMLLADDKIDGVIVEFPNPARRRKAFDTFNHVKGLRFSPIVNRLKVTMHENTKLRYSLEG